MHTNWRGRSETVHSQRTMTVPIENAKEFLKRKEGREEERERGRKKGREGGGERRKEKWNTLELTQVSSQQGHGIQDQHTNQITYLYTNHRHCKLKLKVL